MNSPRLLLILALTFASILPARADTTVGTAITSLPVVLGKPGKYRLTRNFGFESEGVAIFITARDVVLDFNGFTINGPEDAGDDSVCVRISGPNAIVRNGTIRRFHTGVEDESDLPIGTLLEDLQLLNQQSIGVRLSAGESLLRRLRIRGTGTNGEDVENINGIFLTGSATIENCLIQRLVSPKGINTIGMRLVNDATFVVRECDLVNIPGSAIVYGGDRSGILERVRVRIAGIGMIVTTLEAPLLRDSTFRDTNTTTTGDFEDGGRNQLSN